VYIFLVDLILLSLSKYSENEIIGIEIVVYAHLAEIRFEARFEEKASLDEDSGCPVLLVDWISRPISGVTSGAGPVRFF